MCRFGAMAGSEAGRDARITRRLYIEIVDGLKRDAVAGEIMGHDSGYDFRAV